MSTSSDTIIETILNEHIDEKIPEPGERIEVTVDQTLLHDVLGPLIWMEFEALEYDSVVTEPAVQHCDHQTLQIDGADTDTHRYLRTATQRYGGHFSKPGNGICHQVQREQYIAPGEILVGCDSHGPTMGGFGAIGLGAGGIDVAVAMANGTYTFELPERVEVRLEGELSDWASAKDVILELLRRLSVKGGVGKALEFTGPGVRTLSIPERCTITNMTTELGATTAIFPSDDRTRRHLERLGRESDFRPLEPDEDATYDDRIDVDLSVIEPLVAEPPMPDNVVPVREAAGIDVDQCIVGTCTNGSYFDIATVANVVQGETVADDTDAFVSPASKRAVELLSKDGGITELYAAGMNVSEATCGACIGQGHVPAPDSVSLRAFNRNFEGRSGQPDDAVYLASPEVVAASAITGEIVDPRDLNLEPPSFDLPDDMTRRHDEILDPDPSVTVERGATIGEVPLGNPLGTAVTGPVIATFGDDVTTDHIVPANAEVMSLWSDPQACADYTLTRIDEAFPENARKAGGGWIVAGENWGQGSSRENAALELAVLDIHGVLAKSFARIHFENLVNFGVIPLRFADSSTYDRLAADDELSLVGEIGERVRRGANRLTVTVDDEWEFKVALDLTADQRATVAAGGKLARLARSHN